VRLTEAGVLPFSPLPPYAILISPLGRDATPPTSTTSVGRRDGKLYHGDAFALSLTSAHRRARAARCSPPPRVSLHAPASAALHGAGSRQGCGI